MILFDIDKAHAESESYLSDIPQTLLKRTQSQLKLIIEKENRERLGADALSHITVGNKQGRLECRKPPDHSAKWKIRRCNQRLELSDLLQSSNHRLYLFDYQRSVVVGFRFRFGGRRRRSLG